MPKHKRSLCDRFEKLECLGRFVLFFLRHFTVAREIQRGVTKIASNPTYNFHGR